MECPSHNSDLIEFKEEILKKLRSIENKFSSEFNSKLSVINTTFDKMDIKINTISQNNNSLIDLVSKQNFNFEKINQFDLFKSKIEQTLLNDKIQFKNVFQEISQMKDNYKKIVTENLIIPGCIGPGCVYKTLGDYLVYNMEEFNKLRNQTEQNKKKVSEWEKTIISMISNALSRFQIYTDNKNKETFILMEKKFETINNKILDLNEQFEKNQIEIDKLVKQIQNDIQNIVEQNKANIEIREKKLEEFEQKINSFALNFDTVKKSKLKTFIKIKENNIDFINNNNTNNQLYKTNKNILKLKNDANNKLSNNKIQIIPQKSKSIFVPNKNDEHKNSSIINNDNNDNFSQIFSNCGSPKRKNSFTHFINNEQKNNNEEKMLPMLSKKVSNEQIEEKGNNLNIQSNKKIINLENSNIIERKTEVHKTDNIMKKNLLSNCTEDNKYLEEKENNKKYINKATNITNFLNIKQKSNLNNQETNIIINKDQNTLNKNVNNNDNINNIDNTDNNNYLNTNIIYNKIPIISRNKQIDENQVKHLALEEYDLSLSKNEINDEEIKLFKPIKSKVSLKENFCNTENENEEIMFTKSKNNNQIQSFKTQQTKSKENINLQLNNEEKINLKTFISPIISPKKYIQSNVDNEIKTSRNIKINLQMNANIEQQKIMSRIREYYNNRKKQLEKKTIEKMVDCNLINLNLRNSFHIHSPHSSPRNTFYSINNSKTSRTSNLGKTHYGFFRNKERYTRSRSLNSCENKNKV